MREVDGAPRTEEEHVVAAGAQSSSRTLQLKHTQQRN
jgi:hypothetical protein